MAAFKVKPQVQWRQVYKGPQSLAKKHQAEYRAAGYFTRVHKHNGGSFYTLEVGELVHYNLDRKAR